MDRVEKNVIDFMIHSSYTDVIHRTISAYVIAAMSDIQESMTIDKGWIEGYLSKFPEDKQTEAYVEVKKKAFLSLLNNGSNAKNHLQSVLTDTIKRKSQIVTEIMNQYNIAKDHEATYIHDNMQKTFDVVASKIRGAIQRNEWDYLYTKWKEG